MTGEALQGPTPIPGALVRVAGGSKRFLQLLATAMVLLAITEAFQELNRDEAVHLATGSMRPL